MRYGRRPLEDRPRLRLWDYLTGETPPVIPAHPANEDYLAALNGGWQVLGNDHVGDCEAVRWANDRRLVTTSLTGVESYPTQDEVFALYKTQNPDFDPAGSPSVNGPGSAADRGMDTQTLCEYLATTGGPDGVKAVAFAQVDVNNLDEVKAALAIFGSVWADVLVTDTNQREFAGGQPWTYDAGSRVDGAHAVLAGGYDDGTIKFITWGREVAMTADYWMNSVEHAFVVVWPEHLGTRQYLAGINADQLAADFTAITGSALP